MRRLSRQLPQNHEIGAMMCRTADGSTVMGREARGTHDDVSVPYNCPGGPLPLESGILTRTDAPNPARMT